MGGNASLSLLDPLVLGELLAVAPSFTLCVLGLPVLGAGGKGAFGGRVRGDGALPSPPCAGNWRPAILIDILGPDSILLPELTIDEPPGVAGNGLPRFTSRVARLSALDVSFENAGNRCNFTALYASV